MDKKNLFEIYVEHMAEIRRLSTPSIEGISSPEDYSLRLRRNFARIGELAVENRTLLDEEVFPRLNSEDLLSPEQITQMNDFGSNLVDAENVEAILEIAREYYFGTHAAVLVSDNAEYGEDENEIIMKGAEVAYIIS